MYLRRILLGLAVTTAVLADKQWTPILNHSVSTTASTHTNVTDAALEHTLALCIVGEWRTLSTPLLVMNLNKFLLTVMHVDVYIVYSKSFDAAYQTHRNSRATSCPYTERVFDDIVNVKHAERVDNVPRCTPEGNQLRKQMRCADVVNAHTVKYALFGLMRPDWLLLKPVQLKANEVLHGTMYKGTTEPGFLWMTIRTAGEYFAAKRKHDTCRLHWSEQYSTIKQVPNATKGGILRRPGVVHFVNPAYDFTPKELEHMRCYDTDVTNVALRPIGSGNLRSVQKVANASVVQYHPIGVWTAPA